MGSYDIPGVATKKDVECTFVNAKYIGILQLVSGDMTYALPRASLSQGKFIIFKKTDANTTTVTVDGYGSETIDGQTTITITEQYEVARLYCNGLAWYIF